MTLQHSPSIVRNGLACYLDAANSRSYSGSGTAWNDLSGNGRNFTWTASPSFTSDGSKSYFSTLGNICRGPASNSFGIDNTSGYTIFIVVLQNTLTNNASFKFTKAGVGGASRGISLHLSWSDGVIYFDQGGCCDSNTRTSVASGGTSSFSVWAFRRLTNSSTRHIIKNGSVLATNNSAAANLDFDSQNVYLGGSDEFGYDSSTYDARINSFIIYNRGLTDAEVRQNYNALKGRYSL